LPETAAEKTRKPRLFGRGRRSQDRVVSFVVEGQGLFENVVLFAVVARSFFAVQLGVPGPVFVLNRGLVFKARGGHGRRVFGGGDEVGEVAVAPAVEFKQTREDVESRGFFKLRKKGVRGLARAFQVGHENGALFVEFYFFEKCVGNGCNVRFSFGGQARVDELRVAPLAFRAAIFGLVVGPVPVPHKVKHLRRDRGAFVEVLAGFRSRLHVHFLFFCVGGQPVIANGSLRPPKPAVDDFDGDELVLASQWI